MAMPPASSHRQNADQGQRPAGGQTQSASPGQPARRGNPCALTGALPVEPESHGRVAEQKQESTSMACSTSGVHCSLDQALRSMTGQGPRQKEVETAQENCR